MNFSQKTVKELVKTIIIDLLVVSIVPSLLILFLVDRSVTNGHVVNCTGIVRGGSQRAIKLHLLGQDTSEVENSVEKMISGLIKGDKSLKLPAAKSKEFLNKMQEIENSWTQDIKPLLNHEGSEHDEKVLLEKSEAFFELTNEAVALADKISARAIRIIEGVVLIAFLLNLVCVLLVRRLFRRRVVRPLDIFQKDIATIAGGDLSVDITYDCKDEFGALADSMHVMVENLSTYIYEIRTLLHSISTGNLDVEECSGFQGDFVSIEESLNHIVNALNATIRKIDASTDGVARGSEQVADASQTLADSSMEQMNSMDVLTQTVGDITSQVEEMEQSTSSAMSVVNRVVKEIESCGMQMREMVEAMKQISESSTGIAEVAATIKDIAYQTNLLALNAAVESARAGEAGKGFAVIADDVRMLANKSSDSVKGTTQLVETSMKAVKNGNEIVEATAQMLKDVIGMTTEATTAMQEISSASEEQSASIRNMMEEMNRINAGIHENADTTQESAAAGQELSSQAQLLKELVGQFKLKEN